MLVYYADEIGFSSGLGLGFMDLGMLSLVQTVGHGVSSGEKDVVLSTFRVQIRKEREWFLGAESIDEAVIWIGALTAAQRTQKKGPNLFVPQKDAKLWATIYDKVSCFESEAADKKQTKPQTENSKRLAATLMKMLDKADEDESAALEKQLEEIERSIYVDDIETAVEETVASKGGGTATERALVAAQLRNLTIRRTKKVTNDLSPRGRSGAYASAPQRMPSPRK